MSIILTLEKTTKAYSFALFNSSFNSFTVIYFYSLNVLITIHIAQISIAILLPNKINAFMIDKLAPLFIIIIISPHHFNIKYSEINANTIGKL